MNKFCSAPWVNISTDVNGSIRPCCRYAQPNSQTKYKMPWMRDGAIDELYNGPEMQALREAFLNGEQPEECNWCWNEEESGIQSFREMYNKQNYSYDLNYSLPQSLDLKLSNVCNLKCRMCSSTASSSIAKEKGELDPYHLSNKIIATDNEKVLFEDILPDLKYLELTGGEPFYSPENKKIIENISKTKYAQNIDLKITTNAMFYNQKLMDVMKNFKRVIIALSVDDIGDRLEYQRKNANWKLIEKNILSMCNEYPNFDVSIYRTINIYNIYYLDELDNWALQNNIRVSNGMLHEPYYLSIQSLPTYAKEEVIDKLDGKYKEVFSFMGNRTDHTLNEFISKTTILDYKRKESFRKVFPEWSEILLW